jgi:hypothetical protein
VSHEVVAAAANEVALVRVDGRGTAGKDRPMKPVTLCTTIFLGLVSVAQLLRLVFQVDVVAGGVHVPLWASALACVFTGGLAILLWRERRR